MVRKGRGEGGGRGEEGVTSWTPGTRATLVGAAAAAAAGDSYERDQRGWCSGWGCKE